MTQSIFDRIKVFLGEHFFTAFSGMTFKRWLQLLRENNYAVAPRYWPRAGIITMQSIGNSLTHWKSDRKWGKQVAEVTIDRHPVFILGHWRGGTTHLHNLMSMDERFAVPNFYQVIFPRGFLSSERFNKVWMSLFLPKERQIDQVAHGFDMPAEDEFAIAHICQRSCYISWMFPHRHEHYDRYLTLQSVPQNEVEEWKAALDSFVRRLTVHYRKPLVLKSPTHTARIKLLLELYPNAKFVHIHRHPNEVYMSTRKMTKVIVRWSQLQHFDEGILEDRIVRQYKEMYDAYFDQRSLIPQGNLFETDFVSLKKDPLATLRQVYEQLDLPDFKVVEPKMTDYLGTVADYKQADYRPLEPRLQERLSTQWQRAFQEFGYAAGTAS